LSYLADTQTDRRTDKQTKSGKNITSLAEVNMYAASAHALRIATFGYLYAASICDFS